MRIIELRRQILYRGPKRIQYHLLREGIDSPPSVSGIYRALKRAKMFQLGAGRLRNLVFTHLRIAYGNLPLVGKDTSFLRRQTYERVAVR